MTTIIRYMLSFALLMALSGMANAGPPTILVGSWSCDVDEETVFQVSFNLGGTYTTNGTNGIVGYGAWKRTGLKTFNSTDLAFSGDDILKTNASIVMSDNDNLTATLVITILNSTTDPQEVDIDCTRIQVDTDS